MVKRSREIAISFTQGNLRSAWQGLKTMAAVNTVANNHKTIQVAGSSSTSLPNDLNSFFTRFETDNSTQLADTLTTLKPGDSTLTFKTEEVVRALRKTRENSSPGPDNISGRVLRFCAEQLEGVFQTLFQRSMDTSTVPQLWKLYSHPHPKEKHHQHSERPQACGPHIPGDEGHGEGR